MEIGKNPTSEPLIDILVRRLRACRGRLQEVSTATGIPYNTISRLVQGRNQNPTLRHVQKLIDYFNSQVEHPIDPIAPASTARGAPQ